MYNMVMDKIISFLTGIFGFSLLGLILHPTGIATMSVLSIALVSAIVEEISKSV